MTLDPQISVTAAADVKSCTDDPQMGHYDLFYSPQTEGKTSFWIKQWANYRSGTVNSNTVNSKFHLIRSFFEILARILSFHV